MGKKVQLNEKDLVEVLKNIEIMLQSLHRVGSYYAEDIETCDRETVKIIDDFRYCKRLAKIRSILSGAAADALDAVEWEAIQDRLCKVRHWNPPKVGLACD